MDITRTIAALKLQREKLDRLIMAAEDYGREGKRRRGRPPSWMTKPRRGRPPKNAQATAQAA